MSASIVERGASKFASINAHRSFLAKAQARAVRWVLPRIPEAVTSTGLTAVGAAGALVAAAGLVGCNWSAWFYPLVAAGVAVNWFGATLDGALADFRQERRPRLNFLLDHSADLFSQIVLIIAFGLSPFLSVVSSLIVLLCYLLFSAYTYIRATVYGARQMTYIGIGSTEFRLLMVGWPAVGVALGLREPMVGPISVVDMVIICLGSLAVLGLGCKAVAEAREIAKEESRAAAMDKGRGLEPLLPARRP